MQQYNSSFNLETKEHAIIEHFTSLLNQTLLVQQEILAQLTLLNNKVSTLETNHTHVVSDILELIRRTKI
jgi:hypothetical protein